MCTGVMVAVDNAAFKFDKLYSYSVPTELSPYAVIGARVLVPFGSAKPRMGIVLGLCEPSGKLKDIIDVERSQPLMTSELVALVEHVREHTFCTYYDAVRAILPKNSRLVPNANGGITTLSSGHLERVYVYRTKDVPERLSAKQQAVCEACRDNPMSANAICEKAGVTRAVVTRLADKGILETLERTKAPDDFGEPTQTQSIPPLSRAQQTALEQILAGFRDAGRADVTLLHGVTSSGKTLIYIKLIESAVALKKSALVLVPEIALATQMIYRLKSLFGSRVGIIHSALSDSQRQIQWESIASGALDVVVGTRSAVFAPMKNLGIVIIDEEQELSFISEQTPRYDAREIAAYRAKNNGAKLLLASATPSVETYYRAKSGQINLVKITERYGDMPLPSVRVVDMRKELLAGNSHYISKYLCERIDERIAKGEQCILLLNRRGYRTVSMCCSCKKIVKCKSCDTPLVIHKNRGCYVCHYCGHTEPISEICDECGGKIKHTGIGTQKMEEELEAFFPSARILRLDLDTASRKDSASSMLLAFARGEYDMIIGTQMIAKGLDFKNVTLAGVLSIDQLMLMPSFRANERAFSMLTQLVGRSGRGDKTGEAVIQTIDPDNEMIRLAAKQDYEGFYESEILSRRLHLYPPFCRISAAGVISQKESDAATGAQEFVHIAAKRQRESYADMPIRILGPAPMRVAYINDLFRYRVVFKSRGDRRFRDYLRDCVSEWNALSISGKSKLFIDISGEMEN